MIPLKKWDELTRAEKRERIYAYVRCRGCGTRYRVVNDERHTDRCRGAIQIPKRKR
jgi:hypothetical protein